MFVTLFAGGKAHELLPAIIVGSIPLGTINAVAGRSASAVQLSDWRTAAYVGELVGPQEQRWLAQEMNRVLDKARALHGEGRQQQQP